MQSAKAAIITVRFNATRPKSDKRPPYPSAPNLSQIKTPASRLLTTLLGPFQRYTGRMSKHDPQTPGEVAARIADLKAKLPKRSRLPSGNWGENCRAIEAEIAKLERAANP